jgi:hypothetical protein
LLPRQRATGFWITVASCVTDVVGAVMLLRQIVPAPVLSGEAVAGLRSYPVVCMDMAVLGLLFSMTTLCAVASLVALDGVGVIANPQVEESLTFDPCQPFSKLLRQTLGSTVKPATTTL